MKYNGYELAARIYRALVNTAQYDNVKLELVAYGTEFKVSASKTEDNKVYVLYLYPDDEYDISDYEYDVLDYFSSWVLWEK